MTGAATPIGDPRRIEAALGLSTDAARDRVLERVRRYVEAETPSTAAGPLRELAQQLAGELEAVGASTVTHAVEGGGANLVADLPGAEDAAPILILAHIDTVHPLGTLARQPFHVDHDRGRAAGPGIYDMKCGVALAIEALVLLHERGERTRRPVRLLLTCDEEVGSHGAAALIERHARDAACVLVPEPCLDDGGVKTARKGVATYHLRTCGRAGHAGVAPERAVSAITELLRQGAVVLELADPERGTTINLGMIGGGTGTNVVADTAWVTIDVRIAEPVEGERVHDALLALRPHLPGARLEVERVEDRPALVRTPAVVSLYQRARAVAADPGFDLGAGTSGGGSDGSIAAAAGAAVLDGLGARGGGAHAADEHVVIADLPFRLALFTRLLRTL